MSAGDGAVTWLASRGRDDAEIRALLRDRPMDGPVRLAMTREPDSRIAAAVEGERTTRLVARDAAGRLLGIASRSVRRVYLGGATAWLGYLGQLRAAERCCGLRRLRAGYSRLRARRRPDELPFDLTAILAGNRSARRLLERGLPGLPVYRPLTEIETLVIPAPSHRRGGRVAPRPAARPLTRDDRLRLVELLASELRRRPLAPVWSPADFAPAGRARGLSFGDFQVVEDGGRLVAAAALWDQRAYKQAVVAGYARGLGALRPLLNLGLAAAGRPTLPPAGSVLPIGYVACWVVAGDSPGNARALLAALCREADRRGLSHLVVSFAAGHPLRQPLRRRLRARSFRSILYSVAWPDDPTPVPLGDGEVPYVEAALL